MRTLLALVVAAAMVVAALYVRGDLGGGNGVGPISRQQPASLVCVSELRSICEELRGDGISTTVEEAGKTADRLSGPNPGTADAWLTIAPWDQIVAETRQRNGLPPLPKREGSALARSPVVTAVWAERGAILDQQCKGQTSWRCVARFAGKPWTDVGGQAQWGRLKPGYADPSTNATGLLVLGHVASEFLGATSFSARDFEDDTFLRLLTDLEEAVPARGSANNPPLQQQLQFGRGSFDVVGTTEAEAAPLIEKSGERGEGLELRYSESFPVAEVVLAPLRDGSGTDRLQARLTESGPAALARLGWRVEGQPAASGVPAQPALPAEANLPAAGVLDALRARWSELR